MATKKSRTKPALNPIARDVLEAEAASTPIPSDISTAPTEPIISCNVFGMVHPHAELAIVRHDEDGLGVWNIPDHLVRAYEQATQEMLTAEAEILNYLVQSGQELPYPFNEMQGQIPSPRLPGPKTRIRKMGRHGMETGTFPIVDPSSDVTRPTEVEGVVVRESGTPVDLAEIERIEKQLTEIRDMERDTSEEKSLLGLKAEEVPNN